MHVSCPSNPPILIYQGNYVLEIIFADINPLSALFRYLDNRLSTLTSNP